jgi:hypothetical protein
MAIKYTLSDLKTSQLMATGENAGTWGHKYKYKLKSYYNKQSLDIKQLAIAGGAQTTALAMSDAATF